MIQEKEPELIFHADNFYRRVENDLYSGWEKDPKLTIAKKKPAFKWKGSKIPFALWSQVVAFMRWTQKQFKSEAHVTFFYKPATREWAVWPFPQEGIGMTVRLLPDHPLYKEDRKRFGAGWIQAGSLHHHCNMGAFASGVDNDDESNRDGVHFTLGKMEEAQLDIHVRMVFDGITYETHPLDWIDTAEFLANVPQYLRYWMQVESIRSINETNFPEEWKSRVIERKAVTHHYAGFHQPSEWELALANAESVGGASPGAEGEKTTAAGTTILTRGSAGENVDASKVTWPERARQKLYLLASEMKLTIPEFRALVCTPVTSSWSAQQIRQLNEIKERLRAIGITMLYADTLLTSRSSPHADGY